MKLEDLTPEQAKEATEGLDKSTKEAVEEFK